MKKFINITLVLIFTFYSYQLFAMKQCSKCHMREYLIFNASVHKGQIECTDCHQNADTPHKKGFKSVVNCLECHDKMEGIKNTVHKKGLYDAKNEVYKCWGCHTKHFILPKNNPYSKVNEKNLSDTCKSCHTEIKGKCAGVKFAKFRISAHEKFLTGKKYSEDRCLACHHGNVVHGEKDIAKTNCNKCHKKEFHLQLSSTLAEFNFVIFIFLILGIFCVGWRFIKYFKNNN